MKRLSACGLLALAGLFGSFQSVLRPWDPLSRRPLGGYPALPRSAGGGGSDLRGVESYNAVCDSRAEAAKAPHREFMRR